ncbi:MAG: hypothetical protein J6U56_06510 [Spirochaetia bacterium]|nr:hypothetical protein [Spirochaetia bacterium]
MFIIRYVKPLRGNNIFLFYTPPIKNVNHNHTHPACLQYPSSAGVYPIDKQFADRPVSDIAIALSF